MDDLIRTINEMIGRLEGSFKRMAEFTADTSHELRTPLCAMRGEAEVLLLKPRSPEEYQEALVRFIEEFDRLNQMISDLILLSKFDAAQMELKKSSSSPGPPDRRDGKPLPGPCRAEGIGL